MTQPVDSLPLNSTPKWIVTYAERVIASLGRPTRLNRVFERSSVPMLLLDDDRRYLDANTPARLAIRQSLDELRRLRGDDLTPEYFLPDMEAAWQRLMATGSVTGLYDIESPVGAHLHVVFYGVANVMPGVHLIVFAPAGWPEDELIADLGPPDRLPASPLTPRELEVLERAAEGATGPRIAQELAVSAATVRTHLEHIYAKLGVGDRAGAVAKAMRLGLIV